MCRRIEVALFWDLHPVLASSSSLPIFRMVYKLIIPLSVHRGGATPLPLPFADSEIGGALPHPYAPKWREAMGNNHLIQAGMGVRSLPQAFGAFAPGFVAAIDKAFRSGFDTTRIRDQKALLFAEHRHFQPFFAAATPDFPPAFARGSTRVHAGVLQFGRNNPTLHHCVLSL